MRWSWRIARVAGIDVRIHVTFALLLVWIAASEYLGSGSIANAAEGVLFVVAVFATIVLHELGHALTARRFGAHTREITLLPIGGIARLEHMPRRPMHELAMAAAGPAVNVAIGLGLLAALAILGGHSGAEVLVSGATGVVAFLARLMWVNFALCVFNLVPAFPMDGGRILRALLATRVRHVRATRIAARLGQAIAIAFGLLGLFGNPVLVLIAVFVWFGAVAEMADAEMRAGLEGVTVETAMEKSFRTLGPAEPLERAVALLLEGPQHELPIVVGDHAIGLVGRRELFAALRQHRLDAPVRVALRAFETAAPSTPVTDLLARLREGGTMVVAEEGRLVGLLTVENVSELVSVNDAIARAEETTRAIRGVGRIGMATTSLRKAFQ
jgi:Zn-dependent protease/CBS domain-containing protein